jgi:methyltransferase (TIGR00027 family)
MRTGEPSTTAIGSAAARAAHLHVFEGPKIHSDTFALQLIGMDTPAQLRMSLERRSLPASRRVCAYFALRHRFSEERLQAALDRGVAQIVLLGAGLDSFALRRPDVARKVLFVEVDHPASQQWKLSRLAALGLETPDVKYVPIDFAVQDWRSELAAAGINARAAAFFAWLGVSQYIPPQAS